MAYVRFNSAEENEVLAPFSAYEATGAPVAHSAGFYGGRVLVDAEVGADKDFVAGTESVGIFIAVNANVIGLAKRRLFAFMQSDFPGFVLPESDTGNTQRMRSGTHGNTGFCGGIKIMDQFGLAARAYPDHQPAVIPLVGGVVKICAVRVHTFHIYDVIHVRAACDPVFFTVHIPQYPFCKQYRSAVAGER